MSEYGHIIYKRKVQTAWGETDLKIMETKPGSRVYVLPGRSKVYSISDAQDAADKLAALLVGDE